jgi:hypothetical protein
MGILLIAYATCLYDSLENIRLTLLLAHGHLNFTHTMAGCLNNVTEKGMTHALIFLH